MMSVSRSRSPSLGPMSRAPTTITEAMSASFAVTHGDRNTPHFEVTPSTTPVRIDSTLSGIPKNVLKSTIVSCDAVASSGRAPTAASASRAPAGGQRVTVRVLIADDQSLVRAGFRLVLENHADIEVVGEASNGHEAVHGARRLGPDVVLMDIRMPELDGIAATRLIADAGTARVLVLTTYDLDEYVYDALQAGRERLPAEGHAAGRRGGRHPRRRGGRGAARADGHAAAHRGVRAAWARRAGRGPPSSTS